MSITKKTHHAGPFAGFFANAVQVGDHLYLAGVVAQGDEGIVGEGDITAQVKQCYAVIEATLAEFGADLANLVDETWFCTDLAGLLAEVEGIGAFRAGLFGDRPALSQTAVEVSALVDPAFLIEIKAVARL
jgi:2-iminobutanoate/2-iminopropanoate deaminase